MFCKGPTGGTCTRRHWTTSEVCRELDMSLDATGWCYLHCDALCNMALIWCLVCTVVLACLPARRGHTSSPWALVSFQGNLHTKAGKAFQYAPKGPSSGHRGHWATCSKMPVQPLGGRYNGEEHWKHLEYRDMTDCLPKYSEVAYYKVLQHSNMKSQSCTNIMLDVPIIAKHSFSAGSRKNITIVCMWETTC